MWRFVNRFSEEIIIKFIIVSVAVVVVIIIIIITIIIIIIFIIIIIIIIKHFVFVQQICSWGGEEYSLIGSTEWVEQHEKELTERAVVYLNADTIVSGKYVLVASGSPLVKDTILDFSKTVKDPNAHDDKESIFDIMLERNPSKDPSKPVVRNLGSGSDFASFYQFIGVPAADFYYIFGYNDTPIFYPVYHSQHDTFNWTTKFVDPDFTLHKAVTQLTGGLVLQFADMPLLPMSVTLYADALTESLDALKSSYKEKLQSHAKSISFLEAAVKLFQDTAKNFTTARYVRAIWYSHFRWK